jgi:ATP adenylyltransferase
MATKKHLNMMNARFPEQLSQMKDLEKKGICPFCRKNFEANHREPILREGKNWLVTKNDYPYEGSKLHLLLVYKKHVDSIEKISEKDINELFGHIKWVKKEFKIPGGAFVMRFGDMHYNGATIYHLHSHIITGYKQKSTAESLKIKIGYKK